MHTFIFVLAIGIVSVYNLAGVAGVVAFLLGLSAWALGCGIIWYQYNCPTVPNAGQENSDDDADGDACDNNSNDQQPLLLALLALLDPCTTQAGAVQYSVCSSPYGACTTTPAEPEVEAVAEPKFLPMRRNRMAHMGNEERRASRTKADNSWKNHRATQWR